MESKETNFNTKTEGRDIYITPKKGLPTHTLIWMHGLGDSAKGFLDYFNCCNPVVPLTTKIVLLTAPDVPVTVNGGKVMPSWFDIVIIKEGEFTAKQSDVEKSYNRVKDTIEKEVKAYNNDYKKIFIGGFSQGGGLSLYTGMTFDHILGGICSLSGCLFDFVKLDEKKKSLPMFLYHGKMDHMVSFSKTMKDYGKFKDGGFNAKIYAEDELGHSISDKENEELRKFFKETMI